MSKVTIKYQAPEHGWLALELTLGHRTQHVTVSDVPTNPLEELATAIETVAAGRTATVVLNEEPAEWLLRFRPQGELVEVGLTRIHSTGSLEVPSDGDMTLLGRRSDVLLPFWRFLREFESNNYRPPQWRTTDLTRTRDIREQLVAR